MKTKIVLWGKTEKDEKVLVAIELIENENIVRTITIDEKDATEVFYNLMLNEWREGKDIDFPPSAKKYDKLLTVSEDILPDGLSVERPDLIIRAKTEWHFVVLSKKLYDMYSSELEDIKEKLKGLSDYDNEIWEELKGFWDKVQAQIREKSLFRNHIESLKVKTDEAFKLIKELKKRGEKELKEESSKNFAQFTEILNNIEEKVKGGLGLHPIFEELKEIQQKFRETDFSRDHRKALWDRIDKVFKDVKEKRFGNKASEKSPITRMQRRYDGLLEAIDKMEKSIERDKKEMATPDQGGSFSFGQLEQEIRKVKLSMVEERMRSKQEKLDDMLKTKDMLESKMKSESDRAEKQKQFEHAKKEAEEKIAKDIRDRNEQLGQNEDELKKAAEKISESKTDSEKKEKKGILQKLAEKAEELIEEGKEQAEDALITMKAVAEVVKDKVEDKMDGMEDKLEDFKEKASDIADIIEDKVEETVDRVKDKIEELLDRNDEKEDKETEAEEKKD
ncbi:MAG TPA: hypothetical protein DCX89_03595 [Saprospirales bacterium]|nr:hypothetical protein [Saprospirales bacterium]HAY70949.1 hypothetical protein [Saprospirales bacterium]